VLDLHAGKESNGHKIRKIREVAFVCRLHMARIQHAKGELMKTTNRVRAVALFFILSTAMLLGQGTKISAPKNKYSPADDVQLGRQAAAEVTKQLPLLPEDGDVDSYVERVGQHLARSIPAEFTHPEFHYDFSVVNVSDINAFALPGGPMFVNRGMIEAAHSEAEMAGVMAHEISHVALRHGTAQATKAQNPGVQLGEIGGAILGAVIGGNVGQVVAQGTQLGLGAYMLKFSREYETQADVLGSQIMARAGYDPRALASMFKTIEQQGSNGGPEWLSDHPNPGNRYERISQEANMVTISSSKRSGQESEFPAIQTVLKRMSPAPTTAEVEKTRNTKTGGTKYPDNTSVGGPVAAPSTRYRTYQQNGLLSVSVPDNWKQFEDGSSVTFAPDGAYGNQQGQSVFTHGAIVGITNTNSNNDLTTASDQYIAGILKGNPYLQAQGKYKTVQIGRQNGLARRLSGKSPVTNQKEVVDVYTAFSNRSRFVYVIQVVPGNELDRYRTAFDQMVRSVNFLD
jgi:Zn-dependent protease with chaperone function